MKNIYNVPDDLLSRLETASERIRREKRTIRIISHYDADGICAAGILCQALLREDKKFHITLTTSLKTEFIALLKKEDYPLTIFCDMGSEQFKSLADMGGEVIILDHHAALENSLVPLQINPHFFGMNGTDEICAASLAFMFAHVINPNNWDLSALALAGCIGDKQHMNGLKGFNDVMVEKAKEKGIVEEKASLKLNGKTVKKALVVGLDPFIVGMSGREEEVSEFLERIKLDPDGSIEDLDESQKRLLASAIIVRLLSQKLLPEIVEGFVTKKYWLPHWNLYATDLSNYINSCGRMDNTGTGLALCLGDEKALHKAKELRKAYKDELRRDLLRLESEGAHDMKNIQFFYAENPSLAGANAGLGMMYLFDQEKPTLALSVLEKETRISSRGTRYLTSKGLDLAYACRLAAKEVGGRGGGHPVASGATIPKGKEEAFLSRLDEIVGGQLAGEDVQ